MKAHNVILIGIDTLRADYLGVYGHELPTSPAIDNLAREGTVFTNCFSQAPVTAASFMSLFTSRYPTYHGITDNIGATGKNGRMYILDKSVPTLAQILKDHGYKTSAFTDGGNLYDKIGFGKGFDYYSMNKGAGKHHGIIPEDDIFYWLKEYSKENFFIFIHAYSVHSPWTIPKSYQRLFTEITAFPSLEQSTGDESYAESFLKEQNAYLNFLKNINPQNGANLQQLIALYNSAIRYVDDFVSRLLNLLEELHRSEKTIVIFTSDHGQEFFDHGRLNHRQLYNEIMRVPLIIKAPGLTRGETSTQVVRLIDIFPTIIDLLDIKINSPIHGISLLKIIKDRLDLAALAEAETYGFSIQNTHHKYIYPLYKSFEEKGDELYDLAADAQEKQNIATKEPKIVNKLREDFQKELHRFPEIRPHQKVDYLF